MKNNGTLDFFSVLVIGENPDEQISKFDSMIDLDKPYILYNYSDINKIRKNKIKIYEEFYKNPLLSESKDVFYKKIKELKNMSDEEYYLSLGELNSFDSEKNIVSFENPNGKWLTCDEGGRIFSTFLFKKSNIPVTSAKKRDIDWDFIHLNNEKCLKYEKIWDLCFGIREPENEKDILIINAINQMPNYFSIFKDKEDFVKYSSSFWTYAIVKNGLWVDLEDKDSTIWVNSFYDNFIKELSDDTLITIYECTK